MKKNAVIIIFILVGGTLTGLTDILLGTNFLPNVSFTMQIVHKIMYMAWGSSIVWINSKKF